MSRPIALTAADAARLIEALPLWWRPLAVFLLNTGLRIGEASQLSPADVDPYLAGIHVGRHVTKGHEARIVPLNRAARAAVTAGALGILEPSRRNRGADQLPSGTSPGSRKRGKRHIRAFQAVLTRAARRAGIPGRVSPHVLRHTFATRLIDSGASLRAIMVLMGHRSLSSTQIYLHTTPEALAASVDLIEPSGIELTAGKAPRKRKRRAPKVQTSTEPRSRVLEPPARSQRLSRL